MFVFGTRPEVIKLAPLILESKTRSLDLVVCHTDQHSTLSDSILDFFSVIPNYRFKNSSISQSTDEFLFLVTPWLNQIALTEKPSFIVVQGDTMSVLAGGLCAFLNKIPLVHVEAGLRSLDLSSPFPEEGIRQMISRIASIHFVPTLNSQINLDLEGVFDDKKVFLVGNTVTDSLRLVLESDYEFSGLIRNILNDERKIVFITAHRRENFGSKMRSIFFALKDFALMNPEFLLVFPVHPNPLVKLDAYELLSGLDNILLIDPLDYPDTIKLIDSCLFVITDSGGIQEEAVTLGKKVFILRSETERMEGVDFGLAELIGYDFQKIYLRLMEYVEKKEFENSFDKVSIYGDGYVSSKILNILINKL